MITREHCSADIYGDGAKNQGIYRVKKPGQPYVVLLSLCNQDQEL